MNPGSKFCRRHLAPEEAAVGEATSLPRSDVCRESAIIADDDGVFARPRGQEADGPRPTRGGTLFFLETKGFLKKMSQSESLLLEAPQRGDGEELRRYQKKHSVHREEPRASSSPLLFDVIHF